MIENDETGKRHRYVCFHCIEGSTDPITCSNCGAQIETCDFDSAIVYPPQDGCYRIEFKDIPEEMFLSALKVAKEEYLQRFDIEKDGGAVNIVSNDIAYDRLVKILGSFLSADLDELKKEMVFELIRDTGGANSKFKA